MPTAAAIYCRISDDRDGSAAGVKRQQADCLALAERRGWPVAEVFVDNDASAYNGKPRPEYRRMLEGLKRGEVDAVVVWHLDRLHRRPAELEEFFEVCDAAGVKALASVTGDVDLSTHDGRFMARILGAVARKESDDKSRRTRRKHQELAEAGAAVGGGRPFGFNRDGVTLTIKKDEALLIRYAVDRILAGDSIRSIAADWNAVGMKSTRGNPWTQSSVRRVLMSHRIAGNRSMGVDGPVVARGCFPAIVDEATHTRARAVLADPQRVTGGFGPRQNLLTGFLECSKCGGRMIARRGRNRRRTYYCASGPQRFGCGGTRVVAEPVEELVVRAVFKRLDSPALAAALRETPEYDDGLEEQIAGDTAAMEQLARDHYVDRLIGRAEFMAARSALEARLEAATRRRQRERGMNALAGFEPGSGSGALSARWDGLSLDRKRAVIGALLDRVVVGPGRPGRSSFDETRVHPPFGPVWKV